MRAGAQGGGYAPLLKSVCCGRERPLVLSAATGYNRAVLDPKYVLSNIDVVRQSIKDRNMDVDISHLQRVAAERADLLREQDRLRHRRNELAKRRVADPADPAHVEGRQIKERIAEMDGHLRDIEERYFHLLHQIPNVIHPDCPRGSDERDCKLAVHVGRAVAIRL